MNQSDGAAEPPQAPRISALVRRVRDQLLDRISAGEFGTDARLPGELELAAMYNVSRPIVREALGLLRDDGVIYSRRGAGSFVRMAQGEDRLRYAPVGTIADVQRCYEFRISIEPDNAFYAALRWNDAALGAIANALDLLKDTTAARQHREDADYAYHIAIARAANNYFHLSSMQALKDHINVGMKFHGQTLIGDRSGLVNVLDEHRRIYELIRARDAEAAREAMRRHLQGSMDRLFEGRALDLAL